MICIAAVTSPSRQACLLLPCVCTAYYERYEMDVVALTSTDIFRPLSPSGPAQRASAGASLLIGREGSGMIGRR
jgi:hypothetical protein